MFCCFTPAADVTEPAQRPRRVTPGGEEDLDSRPKRLSLPDGMSFEGMLHGETLYWYVEWRVAREEEQLAADLLERSSTRREIAETKLRVLSSPRITA
jgi:hypothetical protein